MFYAWSVSRTSPSTCFHLRTPTRALNHFSAHISLLLSSHLQLRPASLHSSPSPLFCLCPSPCGTFLPCVFMSCKCPSVVRAGATQCPGRASERAGPEAVKPVILSSPLSGMCGEWREIWSPQRCNFNPCVRGGGKVKASCDTAGVKLQSHSWR